MYFPFTPCMIHSFRIHRRNNSSIFQWSSIVLLSFLSSGSSRRRRLCLMKGARRSHPAQSMAESVSKPTRGRSHMDVSKNHDHHHTIYVRVDFMSIFFRGFLRIFFMAGYGRIINCAESSTYDVGLPIFFRASWNELGSRTFRKDSRWVFAYLAAQDSRPRVHSVLGPAETWGDTSGEGPCSGESHFLCLAGACKAINAIASGRRPAWGVRVISHSFALPVTGKPGFPLSRE